MEEWGALRSPDEELAAAAVFSTSNAQMDIPDVLDLRSYLMPVRSQGKQGACVAFSVSVIIEYFAKKARDGDLYFSPQFVYNCRTPLIAGMYPSNCMKIITELGVPYERVYPYGKVEPADAIPPDVYENARGWRSASYARIDSVSSLRIALFTNGPCLITFPTYNHSSKFWIQNDGEARRGGHAVAVVGYNATGFILRNSWGDDWGDKGYTIYPYSEWGAQWEVWTVVAMSEYPNVDDDAPETCKCKCNIV